MNAEYLDKLQREAFNLKSRMLDSEQKSQTAKTRDFKYHIKDFRKLFEDFGKFFYLIKYFSCMLLLIFSLTIFL